MSNPKVQEPEIVDDAPEIVDDAAPLPIPLAPSHGPAVPLVASHHPSATTTGNPFNKGPLAPRQKKEPEGLQSTGGGKIGSLTSSTATSVGGVKDLLGRTVASAGESLFSTLGLPQKAAEVWDRVKQEHPVFADLVGRSAPGMNLGLDLARKTVGPLLPEKDFVTPVIKAADETLERLGVHKDTAMGQVGETVGGISSGVAKASALGPVGLPFFAVEGGIDKTVQALDEGSSLNRSLAAGTFNALTAATIMKLAGGNPEAGEAVYNSFLELAAKKAATGIGMGTAFGATDLAIDKFILNKNMTWGQAGHSMLNSIKTMLGYELAGGIKPAKMLFEGKQIAGQYASPEDAHADIVPKLVDAYASGDEKEIDRQYAKQQAVVYAQQAGIPFKGAKAVSGAEQIPHALRVVEASKPTEEATNASEVEGTTPVGEQPSGAPGTGGEGREGVGQGQQGEETPRESEAPKEKGKTLDEMAPTIPAAPKDRLQEDVAAGKRNDADLADLEAEMQRREEIFRKKIKQRVFAAKGGKGKPPSGEEIDAFIQRDAKSKAEHDAIQSRKVFIEVQREANEKAREATAEKWRKVVPETQGQEPEAEEPVRAPEKKEEPKVEKRVKGEKVKATPTPAPPAPGTGAELPDVLKGKRQVADTFFMDPKEMVVDPKKYQFREFLHDPLAGAKRYNQDLAGVYLGWVDENGKPVILDGHHRMKKALADGAEEIPVKFINAKNASEARVAGAMKNISEGNASPLDAARLFREAGLTPEKLEQQGIPMKRGIIEDASALAKLTDDWFANAARDENWEKAGIVVGKNLPDQDQQTVLLNILGKASKKADLSPEFIKNLCDEVKAASVSKGEQGGLFGEEDLQDNVKERASIAAEVEKDILSDRAVAKAGSKKTTALKLEEWKVAEGGLNTDLASEIGDEANKTLDAFRAEKNHTGEISDVIDRYANELRADQDGKQGKRIKSEAVEAIREALRANGRGSAGPDSEPGAGSPDERGPVPAGPQEEPVPEKVVKPEPKGTEPKEPVAENPGEVKITPRAKAKEKVQETLQGPENTEARHNAYQNGVTPESTPEEIVAAAVTPPKSMVDPERGAVSVALPDKADVGKVLATIGNRIKDLAQVQRIGCAKPRPC